MNKLQGVAVFLRFHGSAGAAGSPNQAVQQGSQMRTLASSQRQKRLVTAQRACAVLVTDTQKSDTWCPTQVAACPLL